MALSLRSPQRSAGRPLTQAAHQIAGAHCFRQLQALRAFRLRRSRSAPCVRHNERRIIMIKVKWWILVVTLVVCFAPSFAKADQLHDAAEKGDVTKVKQLLNAGADVNAKTNTGSTALIIAAGQGHIEVVEALLDNKADVNAKVNNGWTVLMFAATSNSGNRAKTVKLLIDKGADVNTKENVGGTALSLAAYKGYADGMKILLDNKADVNAKTKNGTTALMFAAQDGRIEAVKVLLDYKADVNVKDYRFGFTALKIAVQNRHSEIVKLLRQSGAKE